MSILPDFVLSLVKPYAQPLLVWLSDHVYAELFKREAEHPLIQLQRHLDFGPLEPSLPRRLYTKARRIELAPARLIDDLQRLRLSLEAPVNGGLALVGRRELRSNNSWMHNSERLVKGKERCTLLMHPQDASARGLVDGERVRVASRTGVVEAPLELSDEMRPGVVSLPHGWGHQRPGTRLSVAGARPGVSLNDLTDETLVDPLCGTARLNDVPVEVTPAG